MAPNLEVSRFDRLSICTKFSPKLILVAFLKQSHSSHQALLELEKGISDPSSQLQDAARIVGIDLKKEDWISDDVLNTKNQQKISSPKEEWVLRWLMKKLKLPSDTGVSYRLDKKSWLLFTGLLHRILPKPLASILNENKFLSVFRDTLLELENTESLGLDRLSSGDSESSMTVQGSPVLQPPKRGKKRKRVDNGEEEILSKPAGLSNTWDGILFSVLGSIKTLVALSNQISGHDSGLNTQLLKLVLRSEPQVASAILGQTLKHASTVMLGLPTMTDGDNLLAGFLAVIDVWKLRSDRLDTDTHTASHVSPSHARSESVLMLTD